MTRGERERRAPGGEQEAEQEPVLGKRKGEPEVAEEGGEMWWCPGACMPFYPFGEAGDVKRSTKLMRTTLLFSELEQEVKAERDAARLAQRARGFRELRISAELAARFPMLVTDEDDAAAENEKGGAKGTGHEAIVALESPPEPAEPSPAFEAASGELACDEVCAEKKAERRSREPTLPAPLTHKGLQDAYAELPAGAVNTIQSCLQCWCEELLDRNDVTESVRSFAAKSKAIRSLFSAAGKDALPSLLFGEAATDQDLLELMASA